MIRLALATIGFVALACLFLDLAGTGWALPAATVAAVCAVPLLFLDDRPREWNRR